MSQPSDRAWGFTYPLKVDPLLEVAWSPRPPLRHRLCAALRALLGR